MARLCDHAAIQNKPRFLIHPLCRKVTPIRWNDEDITGRAAKDPIRDPPHRDRAEPSTPIQWKKLDITHDRRPATRFPPRADRETVWEWREERLPDGLAVWMSHDQLCVQCAMFRTTASILAPSQGRIARPTPPPKLGEFICVPHHLRDMPEVKKKGHIFSSKYAHLDARELL
jgi:hypothetical protein